MDEKIKCHEPKELPENLADLKVSSTYVQGIVGENHRLQFLLSEKEKEISISAIWLRRMGDYVEIWIEKDKKWYRMIREHFDSNFSHIIEAIGIKEAIKIHKEEEE